MPQISPRPASPPTTPPAIAPIFVVDLDDVFASLLDEGLGDVDCVEGEDVVEVDAAVVRVEDETVDDVAVLDEGLG